MNDTHFELMQRLQWQRDELARYVWLFAADEDKVQRTLAVDTLDLTHEVIQAHMTTYHRIRLKRRVARNAYVIERFRAALIRMPETAFAEVAAGLERTST